MQSPWDHDFWGNRPSWDLFQVVHTRERIHLSFLSLSADTIHVKLSWRSTQVRLYMKNASTSDTTFLPRVELEISILMDVRPRHLWAEVVLNSDTSIVRPRGPGSWFSFWALFFWQARVPKEKIGSGELEFSDWKCISKMNFCLFQLKDNSWWQEIIFRAKVGLN